MTRILVEKKEPFQLDERDMLLEIREVLNIPGITGVRIFNGYEAEGITDIKKAQTAVFSEAGQDFLYEGEPDTGGAAYTFSIASALGQYDQREDYAAQLLRIIEPHSSPEVRVFQKVALYGNISEPDFSKIKAYYINPNEKRELLKTVTKPASYPEPEKVKVITGFTKPEEGLSEEFAKKYGIAMAADNLKLCREYFAKEKRDPTVTEMKVLDTYWSDHCRHSTFMTILEDINISENKYTKGLERARSLYKRAKEYVYGDNERPDCLMDIATIEMKKLQKSGILDDMEQTDEVNACSVEITVPVDGKSVDMIIMFKNETHNHPTEMEPFGGASTCLGGAIRDPLSGRAHVYGAIRVSGSGDPGEPVESTIPGKLPQRQITQIAAEGYSSYGNGIGLPLGQLIEVYNPGFKAKRLECGAVVAAARKADIVRGKPVPGDVVVLVGGKTGRDGCGGATGSSREHDDESLEKGGAEVQKGNPIIERNIVRLFRKPFVSKMIKKCNDFGAGGICVAVGELADGLSINLDDVPVKYPGLDATELAISESQERMAVVLGAENLDEFLEEAANEDLSAVKIAEITDTGRVVMTWGGNEILNISSEFLNSGGVRQKANVTVLPPDWSLEETKSPEAGRMDIKAIWLENLSDLNVCSKQGITNRFDSTAGGVNVFMPYGGVYQKTPEQGLAMRLPVLDGDTDFGTLMTVGYNPALGLRSPFHAALYAVVESVMKITAMGGDYRKVRLSFQEYFEKLTDEESWGKPYAAMMGAFLAQDELEIPAIGGKDSMSGTFKEINVPPSLISFAVAVADTTKLVSRAFKGAGHNVYLLKTPVDDSGLPVFSILKNNMGSVFNLVKYGCVKSASVVGMGGIAAAISEMAFGNGIGFKLDPRFNDNLFTPQYASLIIELDVIPADSNNLRDEFILLGTTSNNESIEIGDVIIPLGEARQAWEGTLSSIFPIQEIKKIINTTPAMPDSQTTNTTSAMPDSQATNTTPADSASAEKRPMVVIPVFPGSIGEYEMQRQFKGAGAEVCAPLFRTITASDIEDSYEKLTAAINNADILALPSGMSAGAEPDGSAKLIAIILRHPKIKDAVNKLVKDRKGLILGVGEGFKALLKTGLIQTESVQDEECADIILIKNPANKYHCSLRTVEIEHVDSPWLKGMCGKLETVPVSGREITVHMSGELYREYRNKGRIAARYIGGEKPASVEAMISENGLILGRTGLVENLRKGLYANVFEAEESRIFINAVSSVSDNR